MYFGVGGDFRANKATGNTENGIFVGADATDNVVKGNRAFGNTGLDTLDEEGGSASQGRRDQAATSN